jgi:hypothetical protein
VASVELTGLDGSNPLAFLAAMGTLRLCSKIHGSDVRIWWSYNGRWIPSISIPSDVTIEDLVQSIQRELNRVPNAVAATQAEERLKRVKALKRQLAKLEEQLKERKLRGEERLRAEAEELGPTREHLAKATEEWREALCAASQTAYLGLGQRLDVERERYADHERDVTAGFEKVPPTDREEADFAASFGCSGCCGDSGRITPTAFQLITGAGHQYFLQTISNLMSEITREKVRRALIGPWTWADRRLSFRWGPDEDRRYAYAWDDPSDGHGVPSEHGANLLAAMGLPLFPSVPVRGQLQTTGFFQTEDGPALTWPIWEAPASADVVRSLVAHSGLRQPQPDRVSLRRIGIVEIFRSLRIQIGSGPNARFNMAPSVAV